MAKKLLTVDTVNPHVRNMQDVEMSHTVRRAREIERELRKGVMKPFTEVIRADMNDIQAMGQKPITFIRQVLTTCTYPLLLNDPSIPSDVKMRANQILDECGGRSAGSYTYSEGIDLIRLHVAQYIEKRDGFPAEKDDVYLSSGSIEALRSILNVLNLPQNQIPIGILAPVPRDPTFTALLDELGIVQINYYLEEDDNWSINTKELAAAFEAESRFCIPKAILVINPGNPTGSVLSRSNMEDIVLFAARRKLVLLADEAYQFNAFAQGCYFQSFKKTMMQMDPPYDALELVSFMSGSAGILGECGLRCGCYEMVNLGEDVIKVYKKSICIKMCSTVLGQIALDCMICPPLPTEPSYQNFIQEWTDIMQSLNEKAIILINCLNEISGFECNPLTAATFVFPKIYLPQKAIDEAKTKGVSPDTFYALNLLEETGICSQPGALYGQLPGTYHLRFTILPSKEKILKMSEMIRRFHTSFIQKYS
ncbi:alanine aminotransferase 2-like [Argiope bruennichi]|uniref:alanine aminotransferase 2-like n=1 Tax=Argiope bruennichi TaxID=94029 RepID=UPI0024957E8F|nr:alanine aminotransferase 2-like [Argiope bruennichi]